MKDFDHPHVMHLIGLTLTDGKPALIIPFMNGKDLKTYILNNALTIRQLLVCGIQIAEGMTLNLAKNSNKSLY